MKRFLLLPIFLFFGCSSKTTSYITGLHVFGKTTHKEPVIKTNPELKKIATDINKDKDQTHIGVYLTDKYLKIYPKDILFFAPKSTILTQEAKTYLHNLVPILSKYSEIIIQLIGHAYKESNLKKMQHLSDYRAISAAEILYNEGIKQEILAKGCSNLIPLNPCTNKDKNCEQSNRRVDIFIYASKQDVITKCR